MKVMIAGSHTIQEAADPVRAMISRLCGKNSSFLVGDHSGLDTVLQNYLLDMHTDRVTIYTSRARPHHNLGGWGIRRLRDDNPWIGMPRNLQNTLSMADAADGGIVLWDGQSMGSFYVMARLLARGCQVWVYLPEKGRSHTLRTSQDLEKLLQAYTFPKTQGE